MGFPRHSDVIAPGECLADLGRIGGARTRDGLGVEIAIVSTYAAEKRAALDAWANHIRVILWNNVTVATATRTMTKTAPISTTKFTF